MVSHSSEPDPSTGSITYLFDRLVDAIKGLPHEREQALMELLNDDDDHGSTEEGHQGE